MTLQTLTPKVYTKASSEDYVLETGEESGLSSDGEYYDIFEF